MDVKKLRWVLYYLENYASDLNFQLSHGSDFVNYCTDETPEFDEDEQSEAYITELERLITDFRDFFVLNDEEVTEDEG